MRNDDRPDVVGGAPRAIAIVRKERGKDRAGLLPLPTTSLDTNPDRILSLRCAFVLAISCSHKLAHWSFPSFALLNESIASLIIIKHRIQVVRSH